MLDARKVYRKVTTTINDFSPEQLEKLTAIVKMYRGDNDYVHNVLKKRQLLSLHFFHLLNCYAFTLFFAEAFFKPAMIMRVAMTRRIIPPVSEPCIANLSSKRPPAAAPIVIANCIEATSNAPPLSASSGTIRAIHVDQATGTLP